MDSTIRIRQLNQPDLSGFIGSVLNPIFQGTGLSFSGKNLSPTGSGAFNLGSSSLPYGQVCANTLWVPSGSGVYFGNNVYLTAYTSGSSAIINVNGFIISSSAQGVSIIGPAGPSGATGAIGATGKGITGAVGQNGNSFRLLYSDGTSGNPIALPSGATGSIGASGISLSGFSQSGNYVKPIYSNGTTGASILLASGSKGEQGVAGGIYIDCSQITGIKINQIPPNINIYNVDPNTNVNPDLHFIKGMRYTIGQSGLNLNTITISGVPYNTNFFVDEYGTTGYLRFTIWDSTLDTSEHTGRIVYPEIGYNPTSYILDNEVMQNVVEDPLKLSLSFNVSLGASSTYKYGFARYAMDGHLFDGVGETTIGGVVLGNLYADFFGPQGLQGPTGPRGLDGPQGDIGPAGLGGTPGIGVTGVSTNGITMRFLYSDGTSSQTIVLPSGGPSGAIGPQGSAGPAGPSGVAGPQGIQGIADTYAAFFNTNSINATSGISPSLNVQVSGQTTWAYRTGSNMNFKEGDAIQFQCNSLINKAYSPWQSVIIADNNFTGSRYFYAFVRSFNSTAGTMDALIQSSPYAPVGKSGTQMYWNQFGSIAMNLGGLGSPGPSGAQGPQGSPGDTGNAIFTISPSVNISTGVAQTITLDCIAYSAHDLYFDNYNNTINFNTARFSVGETVQVKITNNSSYTNAEYPLVAWNVNGGAGIKFPYGVTAPAPDPNTTSIYTFVRYRDVASTPNIFCTYTLNYL